MMPNFFNHPLRCLFLFFLCFLPCSNAYLTTQVQAQRPPVRQLEAPELKLERYPLNQTNKTAPYLSAYSAIVVDGLSKTVMFSKNPDVRLRPASTTKIMTALVALDHYSLNKVIILDEVEEIGQQMGLEEGEQLTIESLLYGLLVKSGNDAAFALAQYYDGGPPAFINAMNQKAQVFNLNNTQFKNPSGIDQFDHYSTVRDLALLTAEALKSPVFTEIVSTAGVTIGDIEEKNFHELENVNQLLGKIPGLKGVKTGWTALAGECLVTMVERNDRQIITVLLKSEDRFGETEKLIDWVFANFEWVEIKELEISN
ncbi:D-alanyl-D-alanine carboxypeptidase [Patescibacteria group bacterium]|nr:D-alanyl-D-alanine carboxypeptidase [Patescibacteria group bacterium]MBU1931183.1 D-alanyl-D-alanine carboxypeptidase [Patescibacteria group bacterium]